MKSPENPDRQLELFVLNGSGGTDEPAAPERQPFSHRPLEEELSTFREFEKETVVSELAVPGCPAVPVFINEFWTSGQRQAHSLHEISYRACFKPQLPRFFIQRLTNPGDVVYDPFMGRGTTLIEAALMGRVPWGCDINPLSPILVRPRLLPPDAAAVQERTQSLPLHLDVESRDDLLVFYHPEVLRAVSSMRHYFHEPGRDAIDDWLRMVATNRLTGHSPGFFSVYSLPPNQAVSVKSQQRINERRRQVPPRRNVTAILGKKSLDLLKDLTAQDRTTLATVASRARLLTASCEETPAFPAGSVALAVTSPPFLNEVQYDLDNWLRCWFNRIDSGTVPLWQIRKPEQWQEKMTRVFRELHRLLQPGGHVAFEVGEIRQGRLKLEELVVPAAVSAGLTPVLVMINAQHFTKTSNCWGISNQEAGTNTNRIVLLRKSA
jgi:hypothetical protein